MLSALLNSKTEKGFTLIELLLVMAVLGILATLVVTSYPKAQKSARDSERRSDIKQYQTALETYATTNDGYYPSTSGNMDFVCGTSLNTSACPKDPTNKNYKYVQSGPGLEYFVYGELEVKDGGSLNYFVACSSGLSGETTTNPSTSSTCPL